MTSTYSPNRYRGFCACGRRVEAGEGVYAAGTVYCSTPSFDPATYDVDGDSTVVSLAACEPLRRAQARQQVDAARARANYQPSADELARRAERAAVMAAEDAAWAARGEVRCPRCGGAGGHQSWPGYTCFDCGGRGSV